MPAERWPLPAYRHLPGINPRPQDPLLEKIASRATPLTEDSTAHDNIAWCYGLRLLNAGFYWESHEVLEAVWLRAAPNSRERFLVQGIIHVANAALKTLMQRPAAAQRLSELAQASIARAYPRHTGTLMGIEKAQLQDASNRCVSEDFSAGIRQIL